MSATIRRVNRRSGAHALTGGRPSRPAALLALLLLGCRPAGEHAAGEEKEGPVKVQAVPARTASFEETLKAVGSAVPLPGLEAHVSTAVEGLVVEILVEPGAAVKRGQPLVRLDDRMAQKDLAEKKASQASLEAGLALLKALPREPERRVVELEVTRSKVTTELAQAALERLKPLRERGEVSEPQLYEAGKRVEEAQIAQKVADAKLEVLLLGPRSEAVAEAEAKVRAAAAQTESSAARLAFFTIAAPLDGFVDRILCRPGQVLPAGAVAVETVDPSRVLVIGNVPPREGPRLLPGLEVRISGGALGVDPLKGGQSLSGAIASVGIEADPATGTLPVQVLVSNPAGLLRPGTVVSIDIVLGKVENALAVPEEAILHGEHGPEVVVVREGKASVLPARPGLRQGGLVQVFAEGLKAGEPVVVRGGYDLEDGTPVEVAAPAAAEAKKDEAKE